MAETEYTPELWERAWQVAQQSYADLVAKDPQKYKPEVESFVSAMRETRETLNKMKAVAKTPEDIARFNRLNVVYVGLKENGMRDAQQVGVVPVLMVLGVSFGVAGVAWAVAWREQSLALRDRAAVELRDLEERVSASKEGRTLQQSTLPPPPKPKGDWSDYVLPVGALLAGGAFWYFNRDKKGAS